MREFVCGCCRTATLLTGQLRRPLRGSLKFSSCRLWGRRSTHSAVELRRVPNKTPCDPMRAMKMSWACRRLAWLPCLAVGAPARVWRQLSMVFVNVEDVNSPHTPHMRKELSDVDAETLRLKQESMARVLAAVRDAAANGLLRIRPQSSEVPYTRCLRVKPV